MRTTVMRYRFAANKVQTPPGWLDSVLEPSLKRRIPRLEFPWKEKGENLSLLDSFEKYSVAHRTAVNVKHEPPLTESEVSLHVSRLPYNSSFETRRVSGWSPCVCSAFFGIRVTIRSGCSRCRARAASAIFRRSKPCSAAFSSFRRRTSMMIESELCSIVVVISVSNKFFRGTNYRHSDLMSIKAFLDPTPVVRVRNVLAIPSEQEINCMNSGTRDVKCIV